MSLGTIIVVSLALLFFGGIIYLARVSRSGTSKQPVMFVPREQPAEQPQEPVQASSGTTIAFELKPSRKKKHAHKAHRPHHARGRAVS